MSLRAYIFLRKLICNIFANYHNNYCVIDIQMSAPEKTVIISDGYLYINVSTSIDSTPSIKYPLVGSAKFVCKNGEYTIDQIKAMDLYFVQNYIVRSLIDCLNKDVEDKLIVRSRYEYGIILSSDIDHEKDYGTNRSEKLDNGTDNECSMYDCICCCLFITNIIECCTWLLD